MLQTAVPETVGFSSERLARINTLMQGYVERKDLAGMVTLVSRRGKVIHLEKCGWMDVEANKPMRLDTIFNLASMTKPITSVAAMMLYEGGHFHLNTPVTKFIPAFKETKVFVRQGKSGMEVEDQKYELTLRHLFTHTSGLCYGFNENDPIDRVIQAVRQKFEEAKMPVTSTMVIEELARIPLAFQPGTHWRYGMNIETIGRIVEIISGMSLDQFMLERIFKPLGMVDTAYYVPSEKVERVASIYSHSQPPPGGDLQRLQIPVTDAPPSYCPGGSGLYSTIADYTRFAQMLANGGELDGVRLLSPKTAALYSMNHAPAAALPYGFQEHDLYHAGYGFSLGTRVLMDVSQTGIAGSVGEFGWDGAFNTCFWVDPREQLTGILMVQHAPNARYPVAQQFKQLTYQAFIE